MNEPEIKYFEDEKVVITNTRAILKGKTFEMAIITSVSIVEKDRRRARWIILILLGLAMNVFVLSISISNLREMSILGNLQALFLCSLPGILFVILGVVITVKAKPKYIVKISITGRRVNGLSSPNLDYVQKIVADMNQAIA